MRSRLVAVSLLVALAGCTQAQPSAPGDPPAPPAPVASAPPAAGPRPSPLPSTVGPMLWNSPGMLAAAFADVVVLRGPDPVPLLRGVRALDGSELWSATPQVPDSLGDPLLTVLHLGDRLALLWTGWPPAAAELDNRAELRNAVLQLLDPSTGEVVARTDMAGVAVFVSRVHSDSFEVQTVDDVRLRVTVAADDTSTTTPAPRVRDDTDADIAAMASVPTTGATGEAQTTAVVTYSTSRAVRQLLAGVTRYYQVVDLTTMSPVAAAAPCDDRSAAAGLDKLSPDGHLVALGQSVVDLRSGKVHCLAGHSGSYLSQPSVVGDDGSGYGPALNPTDRGDRTFFSLTPSGVPEVGAGEAVLPVALVGGAAIFPAADESGTFAYRY